jgi:hypothetical protein
MKIQASPAIEGVTAEKAFKMFSIIRDNIRLGVEPRSIVAMRQANVQLTKEAEKTLAPLDAALDKLLKVHPKHR